MLGKLIKVALALTISAAVLSTLGCKQQPAATAPASEASAKEKATAEAARAPGEPRVVRIEVTKNGYEPSPVSLKKGEPVKLVVTRTTEETCANEVVIDEHQVDVKLPLNQPVEIAFTPNKSGELRYGCAMDKMISGVFKIE